MHSLKAITPLGSTEPRVSTFPELVIAEVVDRALASLSKRLGHEAEFTTRAGDLFEFELPQPGRAEIGSTFSAFWIGPDSWMVDAAYATHDSPASNIKLTFGEAASVVDQTDGWCRFDVTGALVFDLFERLCNVDILAMQPGSATRCSIHHIGCYLWCRDAGGEFSVLGPRSSAGSLHHALVEIAQTLSRS